MDIEAPLINGQCYPSAAAQALMLESHRIASRAWLIGPGGSRVFELPLMSGSMSCDSGSNVRRSGSVTVLGKWSDPSLMPYGSRIEAQRGIRVARDSIEWMTLGTLPVWEQNQSSDVADETATVLALKDEFANIAADRFDANTSTSTTEKVADAILRLIRRTLPEATLFDLSGDLGQALCGKLDMQKDPAAGLVKIAESVGCELYTGRGWQQFVLRPVPSLDDPPRWQITGGDRGGLVTAPRKRTREKVYNRVVATGETNDATVGGTATPPPTGEATISDSTDPAYYGGPFGRVTRFYSSPLLKTNAQCTAAAASLLEKVRGRALDVSFTVLVNPALDGGDRFDAVLTDGTRTRNLVDSASLPLAASDSQSVSARGLELPDETSAAAS